MFFFEPIVNRSNRWLNQSNLMVEPVEPTVERVESTVEPVKYIYNYFLIIYQLSIYDIIGTTTVQPSVQRMNREPITFSVQSLVRFL